MFVVVLLMYVVVLLMYVVVLHGVAWCSLFDGGLLWLWRAVCRWLSCVAFGRLAPVLLYVVGRCASLLWLVAYRVLLVVVCWCCVLLFVFT